jgi:predicted amidohydrolase
MLGQTVCYDIRFPYLYRELSQSGAQIIFIPAVFTQKTGEAHWHVLNRARAIENGVFIVSPGAIGKIQGGGGGYGHSLVVNPWGEIISDGGDKRGISLAEINLDEVQQVRNKIPSLTHDKKINLSKSNN